MVSLVEGTAALVEGDVPVNGWVRTSDHLSDSEADLRRYEALLEMADLAVHHGSLPNLFHELGARLHEVTTFDFANSSLHDPKNSTMRLHI